MNPNQPNAEVQAYFNQAKAAARRSSDKFILIITLSIVFGIIAVLVILTNQPSIIWIFVGLVVWILFRIKVEQARLVGNSFRVSTGKYSYLNELANEISQNLNVPKVDIFVAKDTEPNAFTTGAFGKFSIVVDSELLSGLTKDEARALFVHEMAHVLYRSATVRSYIRPMAENIQILALGAMIEWIFGFWLRRTQITADRLSLAYTRDPHVTIMSIVKTIIGSDFSEFLGEENILSQESDSHKIFKKIAETGQENPYLITRAIEILEFAEQLNIPVQPELLQYVHSRKKR